MYIYRSTTTKRKPIHKALLACDVENSPVTGKFICAALYGYVSKKIKKDGKTQYVETKVDEYFDKQENLLKYLDNLKSPGDEYIPCKLIFFNLSYDYWFLSKIVDDTAMLSSGTRIITGRLNNGIPMLDLTNHVDYTLEDWIGYLHMEEKLGIKKETLDNLEIRVKSDTRATYELGHFLEDFYVSELGIPFKLTVASNARYLFARHFFNQYWYRDDNHIWLNDYEREGYRGGRVEVIKRGKRHVKSYDVNSMYLSVMQKEKMPDPNTAKYYGLGRCNIKDIVKIMKNKNKLFLADVTVYVPPQHIAPLPYKKNNNPTEKLIFPDGTIRGKYYSPELIYAVEHCGVEIKKLHSYVTYEGSKDSFSKYADFIWKKRKEYKKDKKKNLGMDKLIKKLGNSLYGGFGQRNSEWTFFGKASDFQKTGYVSEDMNPVTSVIEGVTYITCGDTKKNDSQHTFPCIPGFITSYARVDLLKGLKANEDKAVYCDTDCVKIEGNKEMKGVPIGDELGEWGFEYEKTQMFYKPKMYGDANAKEKHVILIDEPENEKGKRDFKIKGVPNRADLVYEDADERTYVFRKPNKMKESIRRGLIPDKWEYVVKVVSLVDDKRIWDEKGMESEPINIDE
jgi:hypothetical protein